MSFSISTFLRLASVPPLSYRTTDVRPRDSPSWGAGQPVLKWKRLSYLSSWYVFQSMGCQVFVRSCSSSSRDQECGGRPRVLSGKNLVEPAGRTSPVLTFEYVRLAYNPLFFSILTSLHYHHHVHLQMKGCDARRAFVHGWTAFSRW